MEPTRCWAPRAPRVPRVPKPKGAELMTPSVGRIVHYQSHGSPGGEYQPKPCAAIITEVLYENRVRLCVFSTQGLHFPEVPYSKKPTPGHWSWPPRV